MQSYLRWWEEPVQRLLPCWLQGRWLQPRVRQAQTRFLSLREVPSGASPPTAGQAARSEIDQASLQLAFYDITKVGIKNVGNERDNSPGQQAAQLCVAGRLVQSVR